MSLLRSSSRVALIAAAVLALAAPAWIGGDLAGAPGRQIGSVIAAEYEPEPRVVPSFSELALGPAGDPLLMAGQRSLPVNALTMQLPHADDWGILPGEVAYEGPGTFEVAGGSVAAPEPDARVHTVLIRVEDELPIDADLFAGAVMEVLNAPQGWRDLLGVSFARTDQPSDANLVLTLATPATTDALCYPVRTNGRVSCGRTTSVTINANNWVGASEAFLDAGGSLEEYRRYVVSHEVGHFLGQPHVSCPGTGSIAPVMLQQTLRLQGCIPNGWPNP